MMKTEKENIVEIALDVKKAIRERAETQLAEDFARKKELEKEVRILRQTYEKVIREKFATYYFGLSTLIMTSTVIGGLSPLIYQDTNKEVNWFSVIIGAFTSLIFAIKANNELKKLKI